MISLLTKKYEPYSYFYSNKITIFKNRKFKELLTMIKKFL